MTIETSFFVRALIFIIPPIISAIWMTHYQNKFFQLLSKKGPDKYKNLEGQLITMNPIEQHKVIKRMNNALSGSFKDKELNLAARKAQYAYNITVIAILLSGAITFTLTILN